MRGLMMDFPLTVPALLGPMLGPPIGGFIVTYALVCTALPRYLRDRGVFRQGAQIIPWLACAAMVFALAGNLYPVPEGPYGKLPYIYLAYLAAGLLWFALRGRSKNLTTRGNQSR